MVVFAFECSICPHLMRSHNFDLKIPKLTFTIGIFYFNTWLIGFVDVMPLAQMLQPNHKFDNQESAECRKYEKRKKNPFENRNMFSVANNNRFNGI